MEVKDIKMPLAYHKDFKDLILDIEGRYNDAKATAQYWKNKYDEYNKDEDVKRLNEEVERLRNLSLHTFSDKEAEAASDFRKEHHNRHYNGINGSCNTYVYALTGTGIGTAISIKCPICGEAKDITDFGDW